MEIIQRYKKLIRLPKYNNFIFYSDYGTLRRSDYREHKSIYIDGNVKNIKENGESLIILKFSDKLIFEEMHISTLKKRTLITISEFQHLFNDKENADENCIIDFEYNEGKLLCIFKENSRRFTVMTNLVTADMEIVAEWNF